MGVQADGDTLKTWEAHRLAFAVAQDTKDHYHVDLVSYEDTKKRGMQQNGECTLLSLEFLRRGLCTPGWSQTSDDSPASASLVLTLQHCHMWFPLYHESGDQCLTHRKHGTYICPKI